MAPLPVLEPREVAAILRSLPRREVVTPHAAREGRTDYAPFMLDAFRRILGDDPRIAYALVFGSSVRGPVNVHSDVDVALGLARGARLTALELGELASQLEGAAGRPVDLVLLEEAPPGLAYRIFRDGIPIVERDRAALVERKARAILEYLDFRPIEELFTRRVLDAAVHGR